MMLIIDHEKAALIATGVKIGYDMALTDMGMQDELISQRKAHKRYGKKVIDEWINAGLVNHPIKKGDSTNSTLWFNLQELKLAALSTTTIKAKK